ncbi:transcription factor 21 isoform X2 [Anabrus simplex]|uniref:transcription factor 21 isoform X2 n=1 Tax=Anabrus simplex TaxID=316456 RepID=UPI0034DD4A91
MDAGIQDAKDKRHTPYQSIESTEPCPSSPAKHRNQANARERDRTHRVLYLPLRAEPTAIWTPGGKKERGPCLSVNSAFMALRMLIPTEPADRKLSKIETLRLASSYISHLGTQLVAAFFLFHTSHMKIEDLSRWPLNEHEAGKQKRACRGLRRTACRRTGIDESAHLFDDGSV